MRGRRASLTCGRGETPTAGGSASRAAPAFAPGASEPRALAELACRHLARGEALAALALGALLAPLPAPAIAAPAVVRGMAAQNRRLPA